MHEKIRTPAMLGSAREEELEWQSAQYPRNPTGLMLWTVRTCESARARAAFYREMSEETWSFCPGFHLALSLDPSVRLYGWFLRSNGANDREQQRQD
ncbi:hypothetical protein DPEC_G00329340 [Dallia pectoralis]|uniref:Uncharacterized protein n=1 Tax=Dallia pectoralis TaxID=75939 RepID=A0ACC2F8K7_DALPE|nr:hypothetical protein DPEC_G00329340 [Dallia pectoralis]